MWCYPVKVECRGFVGTSTIRTLRQIGLTGKERNNAINEMSYMIEKASNWLWQTRSEGYESQIADMSRMRLATGTVDRNCVMINVPMFASSLRTRLVQQSMVL